MLKSLPTEEQVQDFFLLLRPGRLSVVDLDENWEV